MTETQGSPTDELGCSLTIGWPAGSTPQHLEVQWPRAIAPRLEELASTVIMPLAVMAQRPHLRPLTIEFAAEEMFRRVGAYAQPSDRLQRAAAEDGQPQPEPDPSADHATPPDSRPRPSRSP